MAKKSSDGLPGRSGGASKIRKRGGGEQPVYSFMAAAYPLARLCMILSTVEREWEKIVGRPLAFRSSPKAFEDGVLFVTVDSHAVLHDMNFRKNAIVREIRTKALLPVRDVKIEIGKIKRENPVRETTARRQNRKQDIDPSLEEKVTAEILAIHEDMNPELARSIARCRIMSAMPRSAKSR